MTIEKLTAELRDLFGEIKGPVRLHWESDDSEAEYFDSLEEALKEVAVQALHTDRSAAEIERMAYIVTEAEYQDEQNAD